MTMDHHTKIARFRELPVFRALFVLAVLWDRVRARDGLPAVLRNHVPPGAQPAPRVPVERIRGIHVTGYVTSVWFSSSLFAFAFIWDLPVVSSS